VKCCVKKYVINTFVGVLNTQKRVDSSLMMSVMVKNMIVHNKNFTM